MPILTGSSLLSRARRLADDDVEPYYIDDTEMYIWLSEAERALAKAGSLLRDVKTYGVTENQRWLRLNDSPEMIEFRKAVIYASDGVRYGMKLLGGMDSEPITEADDDYGLISLTSSLTSTNRPQALLFGKRTKYAELSPVSNGSYTIEASIITYPTAPIDSASDIPTIAERYHQYIPIGGALLAMTASEVEHSPTRVASLERAWSLALQAATEEGSKIVRDAAPVQFSNDLWG